MRGKRALAAAAIAVGFVTPALAQQVQQDTPRDRIGSRALVPGEQAVPPGMVSANAAEFAARAALSGMFEIQSSQVAVNISKNEETKRFAQDMIRDHRDAQERLRAVARSSGVVLPEALDPTHVDMLQQLRDAPPSRFDQYYGAMQYQAHKDAVAAFKNYAQNGDNAALRSFAAETLLTLQDHLQRAEALPRAGSDGAAVAADTKRASNLVGEEVYTTAGEMIGEIEDVVTDPQRGNMQVAIVGVGGFLGGAQKLVALPLDHLKLQPADIDLVASGQATESGGRTAAAGPPIVAGAPGTERRLVVDTTKEQLRAAPPYRRETR